jgi:hypothetical protein
MWPDRVRISVNVLEQLSPINFSSVTTKPLYVENETINTEYYVHTGIAYDGGLLVRIARSFGVGVTVSSFKKSDDAVVTASVPHPFFYNTPRSITGPAPGLERTELVTHVQAAYVFTASKLDIAVAGGPSFFNVKQGLVTDVAFKETYPYDTATFTSASSQTVTVNKIGFNVSADFGFKLSRNFGIGGLVRYSKASVNFPLAGADSGVTSDAGGVQAGGGVRLFF